MSSSVAELESAPHNVSSSTRCMWPHHDYLQNLEATNQASIVSQNAVDHSNPKTRAPCLDVSKIAFCITRLILDMTTFPAKWRDADYISRFEWRPLSSLWHAVAQNRACARRACRRTCNNLCFWKETFLLQSALSALSLCRCTPWNRHRCAPLTHESVGPVPRRVGGCAPARVGGCAPTRVGGCGHK